MSMQVFLSVTPGMYRAAAPFTRFFAHVAYRIGPHSALLRQSLLLETRRGLLSLSDRDAPPVEDPDTLASALVRECSRRAYSGVLLDFETQPAPEHHQLVQRLDSVLHRHRLDLFVPEVYAGDAPEATVLFGTAVSGGSFQERLRSALLLRDPNHAALDVERLRMDFTLPARNGQGKPLTGPELSTLMDRERPAVFFSRDLCARYFTYAQGDTLHFVLFDDAGTLTEKLRIGRAMGFRAAFLMYPEVRDLLPALFPKSH